MNSEIMCGVVDKAIIGDGNKNSLFYVLLRDYGVKQAAEGMNRVAKLSARWLANQGFSIGIDDVQPGERLSKEKELTVEQGYSECDNSIRLSKEGKLPNQPGLNASETLEVNNIHF
jgi:DNA-directed RNA polymerase III subunit RPC1